MRRREEEREREEEEEKGKSECLKKISVTQHHILVSKYHCLLKGNKSLENWSVPGLGQESHQKNLEFVLESRESIKVY